MTYVYVLDMVEQIVESPGDLGSGLAQLSQQVLVAAALVTDGDEAFDGPCDLPDGRHQLLLARGALQRRRHHLRQMCVGVYFPVYRILLHFRCLLRKMRLSVTSGLRWGNRPLYLWAFTLV